MICGHSKAVNQFCSIRYLLVVRCFKWCKCEYDVRSRKFIYLFCTKYSRSDRRPFFSLNGHSKKRKEIKEIKKKTVAEAAAGRLSAIWWRSKRHYWILRHHVGTYYNTYPRVVALSFKQYLYAKH